MRVQCGPDSTLVKSATTSPSSGVSIGPSLPIRDNDEEREGADGRSRGRITSMLANTRKI
jgi:hypothetical protein